MARLRRPGTQDFHMVLQDKYEDLKLESKAENISAA